MVPMRRVVVEEVEEMTTRWPTGRVSDFKQWLDERLARVPIEYQPNVKIQIAHDISDDEPFSYLQIYYERPETEQEQAERERLATRIRTAREEKEFQLFLTLKKKYEDNSLNSLPSQPPGGL